MSDFGRDNRNYDDRRDSDERNDNRRSNGWWGRLSSLAKGLIIGGAFVLVIALLVNYVFIPQSVQSAGNKIQNQLMDDYTAAAASLHNCKAKGAAAANVATAETDALSKILDNAIGGDYGSATDPATKQQFQTQFITGLRTLYPVSLYPDTKQLSATFDKVLAAVTGCQDEFLGAQRIVIDDVKNLRDFRNASWTNRNYGGLDYPTKDLVINIPGVPPYSGQQALTHMATPIVDTNTSNAFNTGIDDSTGPFNNTPSPAHS